MKPDHVIGLHAPSQMVRSGPNFPITGKSVLLPFLVVEAKKESNTPGFRAIQNQTAFPIRRFLKGQHELLCGAHTSEPCLVWFFAYQGEQWRLYGSTLEEDKTVSLTGI